MDYRSLGCSGLKVSPLCLGAMMFGGQADAATSERIVALAREAGVNYIDTAHQYNDGRSEEVTGRISAKSRDARVLATTLANDMGSRTNERVRSRQWVTQAAERSMDRLRLGYPDIYHTN